MFGRSYWRSQVLGWAVLVLLTGGCSRGPQDKDPTFVDPSQAKDLPKDLVGHQRPGQPAPQAPQPKPGRTSPSAQQVS
jgi:hypothetical protein